MTTPEPRTNNIGFKLIFPEVVSAKKDTNGFYKVKLKNPIDIQTFILKSYRAIDDVEQTLSCHRYEIKNLTNFLNNINALWKNLNYSI